MPNTENSFEQLQARIIELEKENKSLTEFAELSSDWFWEQDDKCRFTRFFGMSTEKLHRDQQLFIGKLRWEMPIHGLSKNEIDAHIQCCMQHKPFHDFEYKVPGDDGQLQHYMISGKPIFNTEGLFTGYHGVGRNITVLRAAQNEVANSQRQLLQILQGSPIPTFVIDHNHTITHWNKACEVLTGRSAQDAINQKNSWEGFYIGSRPTMADFVVDKMPPNAIKQHYGDKFAFSKLINGAYEGEEFFPNMGSTGLWLFFNASPLLDADGNTVGAIETLQNVTDRVLAEQTERKHHLALQETHHNLQDTMQQLIEAKKLAGLGRLVAGVAHELNTPLGNILLGLSSSQQLLAELTSSFQQNTLSKKQLAEFISEENLSQNLMNDNLKCGINLINRFKELSSDEAHKEASSFHPYNTIENIFLLVTNECQTRGVSLKNNIPSDMKITSHQTVFEQIAFSLLENSLRHGFKDTGQFSVDYQSSENHISFHFSDNGIGMDDKTLNHAFDPFYSSSLGQGTSGLGLYRVFNLASAVLGGKVSIQNLDVGLRVSLTFPYQHETNCI